MESSIGFISGSEMVVNLHSSHWMNFLKYIFLKDLTRALSTTSFLTLFAFPNPGIFDGELYQQILEFSRFKAKLGRNASKKGF